MTEAETAVLERLARVETDLRNLRGESETIRGTLHSLLQTALASHDAAISRLSAAHDQRHGAWWAAMAIFTVLLLLLGGAVWLLEHQVQITIKS